MKDDLRAAIKHLGEQWDQLNWDFRDYPIGTKMDKMSQWQGDPSEEIMVVVFKGKHISEPFHRQEFFFIDFAYHNSYDALSADFDNLITVKENDCYIGQPFSGYALRGDSRTDDIVMIGVHIKREAFFREYFPAIAADPDLFRFFLAPQQNQFSDEFIHISCPEASPVRTLLEMMVLEYANQKSDTQAVLKPLLLALFLQISRIYREEKDVSDDRSLKDQIVEYIASHPEHVTLQELSERFSYHPNYISSLLRKEYGMSFSELVLRSRMERAQMLLQNTQLSNERIAEMLGYTNTSNFYKAYKKYYGVTPAEARNYS